MHFRKEMGTPVKSSNQNQHEKREITGVQFLEPRGLGEVENLSTRAFLRAGSREAKTHLENGEEIGRR